METIAQTSRYSISVDRNKNRMYLTLKGIWLNSDDFPNYKDDLRKATLELSIGYTILTDITQMNIPSDAVKKLHFEAQIIVIEAGLKKTAELEPTGLSRKVAFEEYAEESGMKRRGFNNKKEAEAWLDEQD